LKGKGLILLILLFSAPVEIWAGDPSGQPVQIVPSRPPIPVEEALNIANAYVRENRIDLSEQYIHSFHLYYDGGPKRKGLYWKVQWMWAVPKIGMEYGLRIYMDGTVLSEITGP